MYVNCITTATYQTLLHTFITLTTFHRFFFKDNLKPEFQQNIRRNARATSSHFVVHLAEFAKQPIDT